MRDSGHFIKTRNREHTSANSAFTFLITWFRPADA